MNKDEALRFLREAGCSDGDCIFKVEMGGMHTNGGCRCLKDLRLNGEQYRHWRGIFALRALARMAVKEGS